MNIRQIIAPVTLLALAALLIAELPQAIAGRARHYDWFGPIIDTRSILMDHYVEPPDEAAMQQATIAALVESLDDPYTIYVPPEDTDDFRKDLSGHYTGIGAHVRGHEGRLRILSPMDGSPALEAGVRAGDIVLKIDEFDTLDQPVQDCIDHLLGPPGSTVDVTVLHTDDTEETLAVIRRPIAAPTVSGLMRRDRQWRFLVDEARGIAYVRVDQFTGDTVPQLVAALSPLKSSGRLQGLVLDLRGNPGGALPAAVDMAELFLADGDIVSIAPEREDRASERRTFPAKRGHALEDIPLTVLIDAQSASASEIVAGALGDNNRALIVGERSFGKGSVQEVRPLDGDHGMLKFTTAYYYLPSGRNLHRRKGDPDAVWGVDPSLGCVVPEDFDAKRARLTNRWTWDAITPDEPEVPDILDDTWLRDEFGDAALAEAVALLRHHSEHGAWPALESDEDPAYPPLQAELDAALDQREAIAKHLIELQEEILRLQGSERTVDRGLVGLPDDVDVSGAEIVIRDKGGRVVGTWRVAEGENIRSSLDAVELVPVDTDDAAESTTADEG
ncbi:MAG: S41 family peptidase [Phycisphaerales bacterium]|jgi:carboxyl-terminal processing protease|nr:S41 family peptidase [Phycisphaerales bacterium]